MSSTEQDRPERHAPSGYGFGEAANKAEDVDDLPAGTVVLMARGLLELVDRGEIEEAACAALRRDENRAARQARR